ncbi:MAG: thiamine pyrophosphate-dependent enzyme [Vicinamibacterales bacterium]
MSQRVLLGDEAVALAAIHAGITAAYAYPGTPSTEILEAIRTEARDTGPPGIWTANEKTAYEAALGVAFMGCRALVAMKHVGLNVAADPFVNSALVTPHGGLVLAVADDPGMHSSQNEQDSRVLADFARIVCLEPASQQEAYDMTREAFDVSEEFRIPVMIRLVTRLAHARGVVSIRPSRAPNTRRKPDHPSNWILLPANARRQWRSLLDRQPDLRAWSHQARWNACDMDSGTATGVLTAGVARNYFQENVPDLTSPPRHLHVATYPLSVERVRAFCAGLEHLLVLEDGYPFIERSVRGLLPSGLSVLGRESGAVPADGELTPDVVRAALRLPSRPAMSAVALSLPSRPPQLCAGCPHGDSFRALNAVLTEPTHAVVTSDIGCYTLGALPPYGAIESCVCMGASIGMAKGAADAGQRPVVATIGDSTFLHSGITPLLDAAAANAPMTVLILDNATVGMTGGQPTLVASSRLEAIVRAVGVAPEHVRVLTAHPRHAHENETVLREEIAYEGLSVVIFVRECVETARAHKQGHAGEPSRAGAAGGGQQEAS